MGHYQDGFRHVERRLPIIIGLATGSTFMANLEAHPCARQGPATMHNIETAPRPGSEVGNSCDNTRG